METLTILGIKVTPATPGELHDEIKRLVESGGPGFVLSGNVHGLNLARKLDWLGEFYNRADLVRVDGVGVVLGARLLGRRVPGRLTWADWGWLLAEYCAREGLSLYLLGGPEGAAEETARRLRAHAPGVAILGARHGYFDKDGPENEAVIEEINRLRPDILVVALGMPLQERWLLTNAAKIEAKVFITAGAAFEYLAGLKKRCPKWMADTGLEWLYRLFQEPRRLFGRYVWGNSIFIVNVLRERWGLIRL